MSAPLDPNMLPAEPKPQFMCLPVLKKGFCCLRLRLSARIIASIQLILLIILWILPRTAKHDPCDDMGTDEDGRKIDDCSYGGAFITLFLVIPMILLLTVLVGMAVFLSFNRLHFWGSVRSIYRFNWIIFIVIVLLFGYGTLAFPIGIARIFGMSMDQFWIFGIIIVILLNVGQFYFLWVIRSFQAQLIKESAGETQAFVTNQVNLQNMAPAHDLRAVQPGAVIV